MRPLNNSSHRPRFLANSNSKRTLTPTKKVTKEDFQKTKEDVEDILVLFRDFVAENRPQLDIDTVATGETWFGTAALERKLCK
jgi:serine protease SohB